MKRRLTLWGPVVIAVALCACGDDGPPVDPYEPEPFTPTEATRAYCQRDDDAVEARITELLAQLSLRDKAALMHGANLGPTAGTYLVEGNEELGIPGLHMLDGPRGVSTVSGQMATAFPVAMARGASWDPDLEERIGAAMGVETRSVGADVLLAPTMNVLRHPRWGRAQETYGEDPHHMGELAVAFIVGAQRHVIATAKHYAVNSIDDTRFRVDVQLEERTLREIYLPHFRRVVVEAQVGAIMTAYNQVNGEYCSENPHLLRDILKGEWEFAGLVMSDWILGTQSTVPSILAGLDIEMPLGTFYGRPVREAVEEDELDIHVVDRAVRRILRTQFCFGLDDDPPVADPNARNTPEHVALALEAAQRGIVLLKNEGDLLPLDRATVGSIAVAGPLAEVENIGDLGSSLVTPPYVVTALDGIRARAGAAVVVDHAAGEVLDAAGEAAVTAASAVIVVAGLTSEEEGEGTIAAGDRESLSLPAEQIAIIEAVAALNPNTIVVLEGGAAILLEGWIDDVAAVLMAWYPGLEGGHAIADVIFGDINPSGRLPISFPVAEADLVEFDNVSDVVSYGYYHGYTHLQRMGTAPRFPFGYGLSYTTFDVGNLVVDRASATAGDVAQVSVDVTNAGDVPGTETIQLYVSYPGSAVDRPERNLKAFAQATVVPGATETVTMALPVDDLAFWDDAAGAFALESLEYVLQVGTSSADLPLETTLMVSGD